MAPAAPDTPTPDAQRVQRPPAEVRWADELERLRADDSGERPPGWHLSLDAARRFVVGDRKAKISRKFVGDPSLIDRFDCDHDPDFDLDAWGREIDDQPYADAP